MITAWFAVEVRAAHLIDVEVLFCIYDGYNVYIEVQFAIKIEARIKVESVVAVVLDNEKVEVG